ncbi:class I SAM-dependent methyltransferase [Marinimicrobium alkaliphilum]|uniref:class I SAM-dependent methyltransferase n=1 Tax=Marinimicrobium alkaliphilum TaxID=2202654 RepID=UPI000DBA9E24|nr:methyltransferase domain-containing protein [Marinimicrobium alkaliphilum]
MPSKQATSRTAFGLTMRKNTHPHMRRLRRQLGEADIHGNKVWHSSLLLMDYLKTIDMEPGLRVLEIGSGWGLSGIFCAKRYDAQVTALDADPKVFPYLAYHAALNGVEVETWDCRYEKVRKKDLEPFDLVIASDICFWDSLIKPLQGLINRAHQVGTRVIVTDPGRPTFTAVAEWCEAKFDAYHTPWEMKRPQAMVGYILDCDPAEED